MGLEVIQMYRPACEQRSERCCSTEPPVVHEDAKVRITLSEHSMRTKSMSRSCPTLSVSTLWSSCLSKHRVSYASIVLNSILGLWGPGGKDICTRVASSAMYEHELHARTMYQDQWLHQDQSQWVGVLAHTEEAQLVVLRQNQK